jgi:chromosome segregation ATPase
MIEQSLTWSLEKKGSKLKSEIDEHIKGFTGKAEKLKLALGKFQAFTEQSEALWVAQKATQSQVDSLSSSFAERNGTLDTQLACVEEQLKAVASSTDTSADSDTTALELTSLREEFEKSTKDAEVAASHFQQEIEAVSEAVKGTAAGAAVNAERLIDLETTCAKEAEKAEKAEKALGDFAARMKEMEEATGMLSDAAQGTAGAGAVEDLKGEISEMQNGMIRLQGLPAQIQSLRESLETNAKTVKEVEEASSRLRPLYHDMGKQVQAVSERLQSAEEQNTKQEKALEQHGADTKANANEIKTMGKQVQGVSEGLQSAEEQNTKQERRLAAVEVSSEKSGLLLVHYP